MADYKKMVKEQEGINSSLIERQKNDEDLLYLFDYVMRDTNRRRVPDIVNVTLNRPAVFAANTVSALGTTSEQRVVESEDKNIDATYIEDFQKAAFGAANDRLRRQGRPQLNPFFDTQLCIRGRASARCTFQMVDGVLIPEIVPWDARADHTTYELGANGLKWAAYKTRRHKDKIEALYGEELDKLRMSITGKESEVLDVWHTEGNEVWVDGKKILEQEHDWGFTPVVVQTVLLGYGGILLTEDWIKNEGESIFFMIRGVIPELNRLASIVQTLNLKAVKPPIQERAKEGRGTKTVRKYEEVTAMGSSSVVDAEGGITPIDFGDVKRAAGVALGLFDNAIGEGTLSSADLGMIGSPPASGVRALIAGENRDQILNPRLEGKGLLNESLAEMFTRQVIQIGGSVELGTLGHKRTFQVSKLEGEYETTYKYLAKSPVTDAGRYSLSAAAGNDVSDKYKATNILQLEDPEGDARQKNWEKAGRINPRIEQRRIINDLIELGEDEEAKLMLDDLGVSLEQMLAGEASPAKPQKEDEPTQVLSLFGGSQGQQATPKATPEGEE